MRTKFWLERFNQRKRSLGSLDNSNKINRKNMFRRFELKSSLSEYNPVVSPCEHGNESFGSVKRNREFP
jgi:hypothetical protein